MRLLPGRLFPPTNGRRALVVGYTREGTARFCSSYRVLARVSSADDSDEGGEPIARCTLRGTLGEVWPSVAASQT